MSRLSLAEINRRIAGLEAKLNKKPKVKGASVLTSIDNAPNTYFLRRPTGLAGLDYHLGGGFPAGGLCYLSGPDGAGKTFLIYKTAAMCQKIYGDRATICIGCSEAAPDHFFMRKAGMQIEIPEKMMAERVQWRKDMGLPPFTKEELALLRSNNVGNVEILRGASGEEILKGVLDCFKDGCFDLIALDSVTACLPEADAGKTMDQNQKRAAAAGLVTKFFQHYLNATTGYSKCNLTTVLFSSQVRSNPKKSEVSAAIAKYVPEYAAAGAWAAKHGKLIDVLVKPGKSAWERMVEAPNQAALEELIEKYSKVKLKTTKKIKYEIVKGKAGTHEGIAGEFDFNFLDNDLQKNDPNIQLTNDHRDLIFEGMLKNVIRETEGKLSLHQPTPERPMIEGFAEIPGWQALIDAMKADASLELFVRRLVLAGGGVQCAFV